MEQKPHKKEELILANNVLKLAADLLKVSFDWKQHLIITNSNVVLILFKK